ncbi:MAG: hypothetical protein F4106_12815 [Gemmatimonadetes bacterium]|nr:hypothetical protein [Gemmatimonadota bacterium]MYG36260.1 hypothetical protein [Gemmatimonadota bacterium]MYJ18892.1 hypothetical protein [Gemmatimonadota bacterium]
MLLRFLVLVVLLNIVRYVVAGFVEQMLILPHLFAAMAASQEYFRTEFTTLDWVTSYLYNFAMWAVAAWVFHLLRPVLKGGDVAASLKSFGVMWLMFAAVSTIYMNHYSHPPDFYLWNILDAVIAFGTVALANGLLYRRVMGPKRVERP